MLRAIHIKRFGLFRDRSFVMEPVTVIAGANQSGKTTLFDAIRIHAFRPEKRRRENRALYARYGEDTDVVLDWVEPGPPEMTDTEFMNLFAVASGDLTVNLAGDWLSAVKKNLFAGGIDPQNLIDEFARLSSEKGTFAHMRERARLERELDEVRGRLEERSAQRDAILADLQAQAAQQAELKGLAARLGALRGEEQALAEEVAWQERIAERGRLAGQLVLLDEIAEYESLQRDAQHLAEDHTPEVDALEQACQRQDSARAAADEGLRQEESRWAQDRERAESLVGDLAARGDWRRGIDLLAARLTQYDDRRLVRWLLTGAAGALLAAAGVLLFLLAGDTVWGWGALAGAALLGLLVAVGPHPLGEWLLRQSLQDQWALTLGPQVREGIGEAVLSARTMDGLRSALAQADAELTGLQRRHAEARQALDAQQARVEEARERLAGAVRAAEAAARALEEWLGRYRVASRDEYRDQLNAYRRRQQALGERYRRLEEVLESGGYPDALHLRADVERKLRSLDEAQVPRQGIPEEERLAQRRRLEEMRGEIERLEGERHRLDRTSHGTAERLVGQLGNLPEEIALLSDRAHRLERDIAAIEFNRRAAARAQELFEAVAEDETAVLADLSDGVAGTFRALSGVDALESAVALGGLRSDAITARDRSGALRPVDFLSSGARHLLYLALRLEMARRERQGRFALLCLDEPFAFLDPERQMETLLYLQRFLAETGWQMLLFTNEPAQAERVQAVFAGCRLHSLD